MSSKGIYTNTMKMDPDVLEKLEQRKETVSSDIQRLSNSKSVVDERLRKSGGLRLFLVILFVVDAVAMLAVQFLTGMVVTPGQWMLLITLSIAFSISVIVLTMTMSRARSRNYVAIAIATAIAAFVLTGGIKYGLDLAQVVWAALAHPIRPSVTIALEAYALMASIIAAYAVYCSVSMIYGRREDKAEAARLAREINERKEEVKRIEEEEQGFLRTALTPQCHRTTERWSG